jgi:hypothetical protein
MSGLMDMITQQMGSSMMQQMAQKIGGDSDGVKRAAATAVPMILAAIKRNASSQQGAEALVVALETKHSGGVFDNLGGLLDGSSIQDGSKILGHVFDNKQNNMAQQLGKATGIGGQGASDLMSMLAPMVMGALGNAKKSGNLSVGGLQDMLTQEQQSIQKQQPEQLSMIEGMLDSDGDGDVDMSDILKKGSGLLKGFFS